MSDLTYPYASGSDGSTVTLANSGHSLISTPAPNFEDRGGYRFIQYGLAASTEWIAQDFTAADTVSYADVVYMDAGADSAGEVWYLRNSANAQIFNLLTSTTDLFTGRVASTTVLFTPTAFTETVAYKRQFAFKRSTGQVLAKITPLAGGTALIDHSSTGNNLSTLDVTRIQVGDLTSAPTMDMLVGRIHIATGTDALDGGALKLIEPYTLVNNPPTATLTASPAGSIEPGATVTLTLGGTDPEGQAITDTLRQISGAAVTISGAGSTRTFAAPYTLAGSTLVFGYKVNDGTQDSAEATVSVPVLAASQRTLFGGVEVPLKVLTV